MKNIIVPSFILVSLLSIALFVRAKPIPAPQVLPTTKSTPIITPTPTIRKLINLNAPFTSQAPNYDWKNPKLQDGCEEASALMAVYWARGLPISSQTALTELVDMADYQQNQYSEYRDTSLTDTAERLLSEYYSYRNYQLFYDINLEQIINQLYEGNVVILPMDGQKLQNPNFTGIGPERHMVLVVGYDPQTQEFITNDAGTWKGEEYRYPQHLFFSAIRDYHTGYHIPIQEVRKNMLVVSKH